mgnify:CR=1 FL=1
MITARDRGVVVIPLQRPQRLNLLLLVGWVYLAWFRMLVSSTWSDRDAELLSS